MPKSKKSFAARVAERTNREYATICRELKHAATKVRVPMIAKRDITFRGQGIHEYSFYQPAIPGSNRWFRTEFGRR